MHPTIMNKADEGIKAHPVLPCKLETLLRQCEKELLDMSFIEMQGYEISSARFKTLVFRFLWAKLTEPLRRQAEFYDKGGLFS